MHLSKIQTGFETDYIDHILENRTGLKPNIAGKHLRYDNSSRHADYTLLGYKQILRLHTSQALQCGGNLDQTLARRRLRHAQNIGSTRHSR